MGRYQRGYIYTAFGAFHVRYRLEAIVDGQLVRKQHSKRLCAKDKQHPSPSHKSVRRLCDEFMATVNAQVPGTPEPEAFTVASFWELTYWPYVQKECKPSTYQGYKQVWDLHLKPHFGTKTLREYRTHHGSVFLTSLKSTLGHRTIQHIKSLCSGIFTHAINVGYIETNPWHDAKVLGKTIAPGKTKHYTLDEIENIIGALVNHVDCQLIMALAFFLGLRKGEIDALQWDDIDGGYVHIKRNIVRGIITTPKTKKSVRSLPLIQPVLGLLVMWRDKCKPDAVRVFDRSLITHARKTIQPTLTKAKLEWKGFHAGRRGLGTALRQITGNSTAGRDVLGHEDEAITKEHYEGQLPEVALMGLKMLEAKTVSK
ncbi:MAG: phage integrase [Candidatus Sulfotelmatobacter sp.]|nr:phage integrase [Candidatus Sulfotelmatobacter sp.]